MATGVRHPESGLEEARQKEQRQHQADQAGQQAGDSHAKGRRAGPLAPSAQGPAPSTTATKPSGSAGVTQAAVARQLEVSAGA